MPATPTGFNGLLTPVNGGVAYTTGPNGVPTPVGVAYTTGYDGLITPVTNGPYYTNAAGRLSPFKLW